MMKESKINSTYQEGLKFDLQRFENYYATVQATADMTERFWSDFVTEAKKFNETIQIQFGNETANGKSIMGIMSLNIGEGDNFTIKTENEDTRDHLRSGVENTYDNAPHFPALDNTGDSGNDSGDGEDFLSTLNTTTKDGKTVYLIKTVKNMQDLAAYVNRNGDGNYCYGKTFRLANDIEFDGKAGNYTPIGTDGDHCFSGTFDGGRYDAERQLHYQRHKLRI